MKYQVIYLWGVEHKGYCTDSLEDCLRKVNELVNLGFECMIKIRPE